MVFTYPVFLSVYFMQTLYIRTEKTYTITILLITHHTMFSGLSKNLTAEIQ